MRKPWIIFYAIAVHLTWGGLLLVDANPILTAPASALQTFGRWGACLICFLVALTAAYGLRVHSASIFWFVPQQVLLLVTAFTTLALIASGHYADGVQRPFAFIAADQASSVLVAVFHTAALIDWYRR